MNPILYTCIVLVGIGFILMFAAVLVTLLTTMTVAWLLKKNKVIKEEDEAI